MNSGIDYGAIISLFIALFVICKFSLPILQKVIKERRLEFIRTKFALQNQLKNVRNEYEKANYFYLQSFEKKVNWTIEAELIFAQKLKELQEKHKKIMHDLHKDYLSSINQIDLTNKKNYIEDLLNDLAKKVKEKDIASEFDYIKVLEKISK